MKFISSQFIFTNPLHRLALHFSTRSGNYLPDSNDVVCVTSKQRRAIHRPSHADALRRFALRHDLWLQLVDHLLQFQIPDFDRRSCRNTEPVAIRTETQCINDVIVIQSVQVFSLIQVPKHSIEVFSTRSTERTVRRNSDGVQVTVMTSMCVFQLAVRQIPYL